MGFCDECDEKGMFRCSKHGLKEYAEAKGTPPKPDSNRKARARLKAKSQKQEIKDAKWAGIKDGMIEMLTKLDPDGPHCEACGKRGDRGTLELHHLRSRAQGGSYEARNAQLLCGKCHREVTGEPQWTGEAS